MQAEFSQEAAKRMWTDYIYSSENKKLYSLSLKPEVDVGGHITGIDLILRDVGNPKVTENLLDPIGNWHGLQPYSFMANDLLHGADASAFGTRRIITVKGRGLDISIQILNVRVSALPDGTHEIDELKLSLAVHNGFPAVLLVAPSQAGPTSP